MTILEDAIKSQENLVKSLRDRRNLAKEDIKDIKRRLFNFVKTVKVGDGDLDSFFELLDTYIEDYANDVKWLAIEERTLKRYKGQLAKEQNNG